MVYCSEFLATDQEVRIPFLALPNFLRSNGSGTGPTQPRECKAEITAIGVRHADHIAPFIRKSWHSFLREATISRSV
jgi:hypothetical protein